MSELSERLRQINFRLADKAAAEIERLEAENETMKIVQHKMLDALARWRDTSWHPFCGCDLCDDLRKLLEMDGDAIQSWKRRDELLNRLEAENAKLRDELKLLLDY